MSASAELIALAGDVGGAGRSDTTGFGGSEDWRRSFWVGLKVARRITKNKRQAWCRYVIRGDVVTIEMRPYRQGDRASFGGLFHCGINGCPCCGPKIAAERAADIALAIAAWYAEGGRVAFGTWTMRHNGAQSLVELLAAMGKAWNAVRQNLGPRRLREAHSIGEILKLETTVGPQAGWHPHKHGLTFLKPGTSDEEAAALDSAQFKAWSASLERQGYGTADLKGHDFRVLELDQAREEVGRYIAKAVGHELAAAGTKRARGENRTPLELLLDLDALGLEADRRLWLEHEAAMMGKRVLRWSPGLRKRLLGQAVGEELSDQEAADQTDGAGRVIAAIGEDTWRRVWRFKHPPTVLLTAAELYDDDQERADAVARYLARHDLGHLHDVADPECESSLSGLVTRPVRRNDVV